MGTPLDDLVPVFETLLQGLSLAALAVCGGSIGFILLVAFPLGRRLPDIQEGAEPARVLARTSAWCVIVLVAIRAMLQIWIVAILTEAPFEDIAAASFVVAPAIQIAGALIVGLVLRKPTLTSVIASAGGVLVSIASGLAGTHAAAQMADRALLLAITGVHQIATALWLGGLPSLLCTLSLVRNEDSFRLLGQRYSLVALTSVAALLLSAAVLVWFYLPQFRAGFATAYGELIATKIALLVVLLSFGAVNFWLVRSRRSYLVRSFYFRRSVEAELCIGALVFLVAAFLASTPPAAIATMSKNIGMP